jgi:hypothetical protein
MASTAGRLRTSREPESAASMNQHQRRLPDLTGATMARTRSTLDERLAFDAKARTERGTRVHHMISLLWKQNADGNVTHDQILTVVKQTVKAGVPSPRQRFEGFNASAVAKYFALFVPVGARFVGSEVRLPGAVADLVLDVDGGFLIQELKTGRARPLESAEDRKQAACLLAGGEHHFGEKFLGVEIVTLYHRDHCAFLAPSA